MQALKSALGLYADVPERFYRNLRENQEWAGRDVEGPNIANVSKRTFYQLAFKVRLVSNAAFAGLALMLPAPVWDSWQVHLGGPELVEEDGHFRLPDPPSGGGSEVPAWIYVVGVNEDAPGPRPLQVLKKVRATSAALVRPRLAKWRSRWPTASSTYSPEV